MGKVKGMFSLTAVLLACACGVDIAERNNAGNREIRAGNYEAAVLAYQQAQVAAPDRPEAYYNVARAYAELGDVEAADAALEQAIRTADESLMARAYYNLGNLYFERGDYPQAFGAYQQALLLRPSDAATRYNLELALGYLQRPTPTALEQQTEPENETTDPTATPTNQPGALEGPTPTPPPQEGIPDPFASPVAEGTAAGTGVPSTPQPDVRGTLTVEQAERLLDVLRQDTRTLREYLQQPAQGSTDVGKDW